MIAPILPDVGAPWSLPGAGASCTLPDLHMARKATEVCPSKWREEGDATLTPSTEMVGKVHEALNA